MVSFMEQFSKALFGPSKPKDAGHRLGGARRRFDVTFEGESLGLTLGKEEATGRTLVSKVPSTGEAASAGVKAGDAVVALLRARDAHASTKKKKNQNMMRTTCNKFKKSTAGQHFDSKRPEKLTWRKS